MYQKLYEIIKTGLDKQVPATGLAIFRICFGLLTTFEIGFLFYFRHLIFDPVPFLEPSSPLIAFFLMLWGIAALHLTIGRFTHFAALFTYLFWVLFLVFTPMWQEFDGGFDQLMTGGSLFLIFLSSNRALSIDNLRLNLATLTITTEHPPKQVSILNYTIPLAICVGFLYFDSTFHKLSAEFWRNGLGAWLPSTMPYYISAVDMSWLLNLKAVEIIIGYTLIVFQFLFLFLFYRSAFRIPLLVMGILFHLGITISLNIYPFGIGMLIFYFLMVPFSWWRKLRQLTRSKQPRLIVLYDQQCPLCLRTTIIIDHFDLFKTVEFKGLQDHAGEYRQFDSISEDQLLRDLYALDRKGRLYNGIDTYIQILFRMRYLAVIGLLMKIPGIYTICNRIYRRIADQRKRLACDADCKLPAERSRLGENILNNLIDLERQRTHNLASRISKLLVIAIMLQLNSTIHYGIIYRLDINRHETTIGRLLTNVSDGVLLFSHGFLGITPHGLYLHDHLEGFNHLFAFTYRNQNNQEKWLPFVNPEGRIIAPNWGRVQSMWANVAVMADVDSKRFYKYTKKVTAFWGKKTGLDLDNAQLTIKVKKIHVPMTWKYDLRHRNIAQPWENIGQVIWKNGSMDLRIPEVNIDSW